MAVTVRGSLLAGLVTAPFTLTPDTSTPTALGAAALLCAAARGSALVYRRLRVN
ncbi:hypothetical protein [Streptomyces sp. t39]|uniref:hypothetical protein n=1 Tax=Streptomyces sp. t39 TaxID=1828156 RepID=UPI001650AC15|nr:hypothetical protein [Streptomyces sp. t39]